MTQISNPSINGFELKYAARDVNPNTVLYWLVVSGGTYVELHDVVKQLFSFFRFT